MTGRDGAEETKTKAVPMRRRLLTRGRLTLLLALLLAAALVNAFWPRPVLVDLGEVRRTALQVNVEEEAKTRVREAYVVSAPVTGRLLRIEAEPGDRVEGQATQLARLLPGEPAFLDLRAESQARADMESAEAALALAKAEEERARAELTFAGTELDRARKLLERGVISQAHLDRLALAHASAQAALQTARAAVRVRQAEMANVEARLLGPRGNGSGGNGSGGNGSGGNGPDGGLATGQALAEAGPHTVTIRAPVGGVVLQVLQESEAMVLAGTPILVIGDPLSDLEVVAELLSTDAVRVAEGDPVMIDAWGGGAPLHGEVVRVEPYGFTKVSALGVEEQRVNAVIRIIDPPQERPGLGHGFRVTVRIVVWEAADLLTVPSSALFRNGAEWAVFVAEDGRARMRPVAIGHNNGIRAEVLDGLSAGDDVVLYPSDRIADGMRVAQRQVTAPGD
ncbi:efflux RND transporter periplasmic adaptor subunit [Marinibaculum pumilum]|uniref:Efflux RND transporter periplasmic adaptor subunit n=1 Tax=Marinibaculum pumilum TaxID=1766165 RepID=A0ABV7L342_9PROT